MLFQLYLNKKLLIALSLIQPVIDSELVDNYTKQISRLIDEQRIGPELRIQDFDDYVCLLNGTVSFLNDYFKIKNEIIEIDTPINNTKILHITMTVSKSRGGFYKRATREDFWRVLRRVNKVCGVG